MLVDCYYAGRPEGAASAAVRAGELGYDGFFTAETAHDPFLPLALAAGTPVRLDLGTAIAVAFPRSPTITAHLAWDLARLSGGRFILGLGTQVRAHITRRFSSDWDRPAARLRDYILAIRAVWEAWQQGAPLDHRGEFYRLSLMTPFFDPGPIDHPDIPVAVAGVGPGLSRLAGELCQGFHVHPFHTVRYLDQVVLPALSAGAASGGRGLDACRRMSAVLVVTGRDQVEMEQAMAGVRRQIAFYASTPSYAPVLAANDWDFGDRLTAMSRRRQWDEMGAVISDEVVAEVAVVAPLDRVGAALRDRYGDRLQRVGLYALGGGASWPDEAVAQVVADIRAR